MVEDIEDNSNMYVTMLGLIYIITIFSILNISCSLNSDLIISFSQSKNLTMGSVFGCMKKKGKYNKFHSKRWLKTVFGNFLNL